MTDELKPCPFCGGEAYKSFSVETYLTFDELSELVVKLLRGDA